ncbi:hypothetical protein AUR04nite_34810 [Glutamicibacter uratoxydans]|uniref:Uncharacterized protein n=1 Tax=Glutamicibacter uratoxydans TaxID=43667 RepID=A0A4Y4DRI4_GLUUR|nr:hypothetical protein AUR04nite_34810 [Glutamicibacter uratoxydans]
MAESGSSLLGVLITGIVITVSGASLIYTALGTGSFGMTLVGFVSLAVGIPAIVMGIKDH